MLFWDILAVACMALLAGALFYRYAERKKIKWEAFRREMDEAERAFCEQAEREAGLLRDNAELMREDSAPEPRSGLAPEFRGKSASELGSGSNPPIGAGAGISALPAALAASAPSLGALQGAEMKEFADRLRELNVLGALEGRVEMPPPEPPGLIYRLRDGKTALLLDSVPNERFLAHHARRFDYILIRGREGNSFAIQRTEDFITARTAL